MDVSRGHLFLAGGVAVAAVIAGVLATTADASQARDAGSAMRCNPGYHVEEVRDINLPDGRVGAAQVCARATGKASAPSTPPAEPTSPPVTSATAPVVPQGRATVTVTGPAPGPRTTVTVRGPRVTVTLPARTVRITVTAPAR